MCIRDRSSGSFGYFPSYALGNAYGAQMLHNMEQDVDVEDSIAKGELAQYKDMEVGVGFLHGLGLCGAAHTRCV